jgi:hypothetical protein
MFHIFKQEKNIVIVASFYLINMLLHNRRRRRRSLRLKRICKAKEILIKRNEPDSYVEGCSGKEQGCIRIHRVDGHDGSIGFTCEYCIPRAFAKIELRKFRNALYLQMRRKK